MLSILRSFAKTESLRLGLSLLVAGIVRKVCLAIYLTALDTFGCRGADRIDFIAKPWAVDIPLQIGKLTVKPGDILVADEGEMACCVIPRDKLDDVMELLPTQKEADDGFLNDVQNGMDIKSALSRWPKHYSISDPKPQ